MIEGDTAVFHFIRTEGEELSSSLLVHATITELEGTGVGDFISDVFTGDTTLVFDADAV